MASHSSFKSVHVPPQQAEILLGILSDNKTHVLNLNRLLQIERAHLEKREREKLTHLLEEKAQCLHQIGQTEQRLERLLMKLSNNLTTRNISASQPSSTTARTLIDAHSIESIITQCPEQYKHNLHLTWEQLKEALHECQFLNSINGQIIHKSKANIDTILAMMRGHSTHTNLYHADGHKEHCTEQRTLAKA